MSVKRSMLISTATAMAAAFAASSTAFAGAIIINTNELASFGTAFGGNAGAARTAYNAAVTEIQNTFTSAIAGSITINIDLAGSTAAGVFGQSNTIYPGTTRTYAQIVSLLDSHKQSADDITAVSKLPGSDPVSGGAGAYYLTRAQAKSLGVLGASSSTDGTVTFGASTNFGAGFTFGTTAASRVVAGKSDFMGVVLHEISEVMGRSGLLGTGFGGTNDYGIYDLFGYTANGVPSTNDSTTGVYFSIDGGLTNLKDFNDPGNGGDLRDWKTTSPYSPDSFNAFSQANQLNDLTAVDLRVMDVIGYNIAPVPEPTTVFGFGVAAIGVAYTVRRRRAA